MTTLTAVGLAVQDFVFSMDEPVITGEKNFAVALEATGGGPAANAAVTMARLGTHARLISAVGTDALGDAAIAELAGYGVDASLVRRVDAPTPLSAVLISPDGDRTIVNRTDPGLWSAAPPPTTDDLQGSDAVLVDVRWPAGAASAIRHAAAMGIPSIVDCDATDQPIDESVLRDATYVVFAESAMGQRGLRPNASGVQEAASRWGITAAVTKGSEGALWSDGGPARHVPAFSVRAIDTLGAGDVFHGAFAVGIARGQDTESSLRFASGAAAIRCARGGGRRGIPDGDELTAFLEENA